MKVLINSDFIALRCGEFVKADENIGEFIFDTEKSDLTLGVVAEIAAANKIKLTKSKNKPGQTEELIEGLKSLNLSEINKMSNSEKAAEIIERGFAEEKSDEEIIVEIIQSGVKFKEAGRLFKTLVEKLGLRLSMAAKKEKAYVILEDIEFNPETWEDVESAAAKISEKIADTPERAAINIIKKWAKENEFELPKKAAIPKKSFHDQVIDFLVENQDSTIESLSEFITNKKPKNTPERTQKTAARYMGYIEFHNRCAG